MGSVNRTGMLLILAAAVLWGTSGATGRYLSESYAISPFSIAFYRLAIGAVVLSVLKRPGALLVSRRQLGVLALVGAGMALYQAAFFVAVGLAGVSLATLVALGMAPVLVAVLSIFVLKQAPETRVLLSLAAALAGLCLLVGGPTGDADHALLGAGLATLSAVGFAGVTLLGRWLSAHVASPVTTLCGFGIGAAVLLPIALAHGLRLPHDLTEAGVLLYLGIGPTALAYSAFFLGVRWVVPSASSILTLVEPLTATLIAVVLFQERLSALGLLGGALMILAVAALCLAMPLGRNRRAELSAR